MRLIVDGKPIAFTAGDNLLVSLLRADLHPTSGGCLCMGGDCPNCIVTVDGVSYVRACQTQARPGMVVNRDHLTGDYPPLPLEDPRGATVQARNVFCDVVVIGQGESGKAAAAEAEAAGKSVITLDALKGEEAIGVYAGPLVVARTLNGMLHVNAKEEVIVATGAAEIQPVAPGAELAGIATARAVEQFAAAGLDLGRVVAVGTPPEGVECQVLSAELVRFEGEGHVSAVVVQDDDGNEQTVACDTVSIGLGFHPRNALALMGHDMPQVKAIGDATVDADIPKCPTSGMACACSGVSMDDLNFTWDSGFREMELIKRSTLAGTGTCQGMACIPYLQSFILEKGKELQPRFTARPVNRQLTIEEIAAGAHFHPMAETAMDEQHRKLGAQMERSGGWWRPWTYGDTLGEYWAVREGVSIMDVSTLGKMIVSGPDSLELLERLYPTKVRTIRQGRSRYVLILDERGYVMDDGLIAKESDTRYALTFTSGGSSHSEMWFRDWAESWGFNVRLMNQTHAIGAINVTGPLTNELLAKLGLEETPKYMRFVDTEVAGVPCRVYRLSFTGELSYELHHPVEYGPMLWDALMDAGQEYGIKPHGLEALRMLRLEKGHVIIGQDTDFDSSARRIHHDWAIKLDKEFFIGKGSVVRTNAIDLDKQLVGLEMEGEPPLEGATIWYNGEYAGYTTSCTWSPILGKSVMMGWVYLFDGEIPAAVQINGRTATRAELPFYDKEAARARA